MSISDISLLLLSLSLGALAGCGGQETRDSRRPVSEAGASNPTKEKRSSTGSEEAAVPRRVVLFVPRTGVMMILVNEHHPWRKTRKGRLRLALGKPQQGYKVLTDRQMDALVESLKRRSLSRFATPFEKGDEDYFRRRPDDARYRGILYLEEGSRRLKVLSFRPYGPEDMNGQERLRAFIDFKALVYRWYNSRVETEVPMTGAVIGEGGR